MMKRVIALFLAATASVAMAGPLDNECPMSREEKLVCSVLLCNPIGLAIPESRSECLKVNRDFAIYLATLGLFDKPPKCFARDQHCNKVGRASNAQMSPEYCLQAGDEHQQAMCLAALESESPTYCDQFEDTEKAVCESLANPP